MSNYTKGKWFNNGGRIYAQQGDDIREICDVGIINSQTLEDTANARLIAAAPDLYEATKAAQIMLLQTNWNGDERMNIIGQAIAKAEKEQK